MVCYHPVDACARLADMESIVVVVRTECYYYYYYRATRQSRRRAAWGGRVCRTLVRGEETARKSIGSGSGCVLMNRLEAAFFTVRNRADGELNWIEIEVVSRESEGVGRQLQTEGKKRW